MGWTRDQAIKYYNELSQTLCETVEIDGEVLEFQRDTRCSLNPFKNSKMAVNLDDINIDRELRLLGLVTEKMEVTPYA